jgi:MFS family permease
VTFARRRNERVAVISFPARQATFRDVFTVREFRALWASQILSEGGDRLALVALTLLIYDRTRSPLLAALAYAAGYLPWIIGGLFFSGFGDRLPRREVMVACDVFRALLVAAMLIPRTPVAGLVGLLYLTTTAQAPFEAARSAILPEILRRDRYALAAAVMQTTFRVALVAGAAVGGVTVALIGARAALGVDAATFAASAVLVRFGTRARPATAEPDFHALKQLREGVRLLLGDKTIRTLMMLGWLIALYSIPEGIAAPYAARLSGGPVAAGLVIASGQVGAVLVTPIFTKSIGPLTRLRWMGPMAVCTCAVLPLTVFRPGLAGSMAIFALSGTFAIYQIAANTAFVQWVPAERRAQAFGLASIGTVVSQGGALMVAGAAAEVMPPATVIALGGGVGALTACGLALRWRHMSPAVGRHSARHMRGLATLTRPKGCEARSAGSRRSHRQLRDRGPARALASGPPPARLQPRGTSRPGPHGWPDRLPRAGSPAARKRPARAGRRHAPVGSRCLTRHHGRPSQNHPRDGCPGRQARHPFLGRSGPE